MGKTAVRLKEVVYTLSPFQQNVMGGLFKDVTHKVMHQVKEKAFDISVFCILPVWGTVSYANAYKEAEKLDHRF